MKKRSLFFKGSVALAVWIVFFFVTNFIVCVIEGREKVFINENISVNILSFFLGFFISVIVMLFMNLIAIKRSDKKHIYEMAYIDKVTGLGNKNKFILETAGVLTKNKEKYAVVVLEVNNFEVINEHFGLDEGDAILKYIADILKANIFEGEIVSRAGAGRFNLLIKYDDNDGVKTRLEMLMDDISEYRRTDTEISKCSVTSCCGIYIINDTDIFNNLKETEFNISNVIGRAKFALSQILGKYMNYCAFYDEETRNQLISDSDVEYAIKNNEFVVYIQPKYDIKDHTLSGGEALVRWNHHSKGFLTPDKFVPVFEKNGFIVDLDMFVFETVCKMQRKWLDMGVNPVRISVNQSRMHLFKRDYVENLKEILDKYSLPAELIELEITETIAFESMDVISEVLKRLHDIGFKISMDDFGSGYSSLNMLKNLDVDVLKIDKGFFEETSNSKRGQDIIESIIDMASKLGMETVAEGVETVEQAELLQENGCDIAQGYFYAMPMPISDYENLQISNKKDSGE